MMHIMFSAEHKLTKTEVTAEQLRDAQHENRHYQSPNKAQTQKTPHAPALQP